MPAEPFGAFLKRLRRDADITQEAVADALHIERSVYTKMENDPDPPDWVERFNTLVQELPTTPEVLMRAAGVNVVSRGDAARIPKRLIDMLLELPSSSFPAVERAVLGELALLRREGRRR